MPACHCSPICVSPGPRRRHGYEILGSLGGHIDGLQTICPAKECLTTILAGRRTDAQYQASLSNHASGGGSPTRSVCSVWPISEALPHCSSTPVYNGEALNSVWAKGKLGGRGVVEIIEGTKLRRKIHWETEWSLLSERARSASNEILSRRGADITVSGIAPRMPC